MERRIEGDINTHSFPVSSDRIPDLYMKRLRDFVVFRMSIHVKTTESYPISIDINITN